MSSLIVVSVMRNYRQYSSDVVYGLIQFNLFVMILNKSGNSKGRDNVSPSFYIKTKINFWIKLPIFLFNEFDPDYSVS